MIHFAPIIWIAIFASQRSKQAQAPRPVDRALENLKPDDCILLADGACSRFKPDDMAIDITLARKGFAQALLGLHKEAAETLDPLRVDAFSPEERFRFFASRVLIWLLADRVDAARDVMEVDFTRLARLVVWPSLRERYRLAEAAFRAFDEGGERHRRKMEKVSRWSWNRLDKLLAHLLLARLDWSDERVDSAVAHLEVAATLGPHTLAPALLRDARAWRPVAH